MATRKNPVPALKSKTARSIAAKKTPARKVAKKTTMRRKNPAPSADTERASDLYRRFTGHEPESIGRVKVNPLPKVAACIGTCDGILYTTVRDGVTEKYIHKFKARDKPLFCVDPSGKQLMLVGGAYDFTERGIVDESDRSR